MPVKTMKAGNKEVIVQDCSHLPKPEDAIGILKEGYELLRIKPEKSAYTIIDFTGLNLSGETGAEAKRYAQLHAPYLKMSAVIGMNPAIFKVLKAMSKMEMELFDSVEQALKYIETAS